MQSTNLILVKRGSSGIVLDRDRGIWVPVFVGLEKELGLSVAADLHLGKFSILPLVHRHRSDEGEVNSEAAMLSGAFKANPDPVGD